MDFDFLELDSTWAIAIFLALVMSLAIWFLPSMFGAKEYPLYIKICVPIVLVPISYFVVNHISGS